MVKTEICEYCGKERPEPDMIYVDVFDAYFCGQSCLDNYQLDDEINTRDAELEDRKLWKS